VAALVAESLGTLPPVGLAGRWSLPGVGSPLRRPDGPVR
jgi:hypothetical protein